MKWRAIAIVIICALGFLGVGVAFDKYTERLAQPTRDLSKMMSVRQITSDALSSYYKEHGAYPKALSELPLDTLPWGDEGSSPQDLKNWQYNSDGQSFTMTWINGDRYDLFLSGNMGLLFYSRDEAQQNTGHSR